MEFEHGVKEGWWAGVGSGAGTGTVASCTLQLYRGSADQTNLLLI